jgi:VWFA-related protein
VTIRRCVPSVAAVLGCSVTLAAQTATFSTRVEAVHVDVLVARNGQIVHGLEAGDFEVRDEGVVQDVELVSFEELPLGLVLAFDVSASVSGERLEHLQGAGLTLLEQLTARDQAALLTFSQVITLQQALTKDVSQVSHSLLGVTPFGETALVDASYAALTLGGSGVGRTLLILFSDGIDTASWLAPDAVLESAGRSDVVVYGVVVRGRTRADFVDDLSELTGGSVFQVDSTRDLSAAFIGILEQFRQRYLLSYMPRGVSRRGWHRLDVRVRGRGLDVKARAGYQAGS